MILRIVIDIAVYCFIGWLLCDISPDKTYSWYAGIWHGMFVVPNFIRSWFTDALIIAPCRTAAYTVLYWIFAVLAVLGLITGSTRRNGPS